MELHFSLKSTALFIEKHCAFMELCFSLRSTALFIELCFSLKSIALFMKSTALFMTLHFSLKSTVLFMKLCFSLKKHCAFHWKVTKTADSTQISHYDLVFHRVQSREGQLGISYILVVFGGACMCIWCMNAHICLHCVLNWLLSRPFDLILSLYTQLTPFKTICPNFIIAYPIDSFQDHLT